ncbi:hypothetical protein NUW54_g11784 [Trametes sanguinea]|uniref:Uncharacterized protein n=1 Tax=Trametes sanguinea TaxID=158606 RepID=A0ACC1N7X9_9APHY|nr:hypothetical protein NUW54_g11784 [Trametes sanguinea]
MPMHSSTSSVHGPPLSRSLAPAATTPFEPDVVSKLLFCNSLLYGTRCICRGRASYLLNYPKVECRSAKSSTTADESSTLRRTTVAQNNREGKGVDGDHNTFELSILPPSSSLSQHPRDSALTIEDSVHYLPNNSAEWSSTFPIGSSGFVRLGPRGRLFGVSMFHQLHCLDKMRRAVVEPPPSEWESWHTQHCLNYVRQMLLCAANVRLEPVKEIESHAGGKKEAKVDGLGLEHQCRDWSVLRKAAEENYLHWPKEGE